VADDAAAALVAAALVAAAGAPRAVVSAPATGGRASRPTGRGRAPTPRPSRRSSPRADPRHRRAAHHGAPQTATCADAAAVAVARPSRRPYGGGRGQRRRGWRWPRVRRCQEGSRDPCPHAHPFGRPAGLQQQRRRQQRRQRQHHRAGPLPAPRRTAQGDAPWRAPAWACLHWKFPRRTPSTHPRRPERAAPRGAAGRVAAARSRLETGRPRAGTRWPSRRSRAAQAPS